MKHILTIISALLLSSCVGNYRADYGIVIKVIREDTSNEVTIRLSGGPRSLVANPYQVFEPTVRDELVFHTPHSVRYAIGDTIRFVK